MNPLRVLVCGTNYGRIYLEAIRLGGAAYRLAGILARGSPLSQEVACAYGTPLYRCVDDLGPAIDLACAAMGTSGARVIPRLLSNGIHVLCEHPQRPDQLQAALDAAACRGTCFHVNGHFADLDAAAVFIRHCRQQSQSTPPSFFHVMATDRSLYATLDILHRVLVSFKPFEFHLASRLVPFTIVQGHLGGVPIAFHLQRGTGRRPLPDASPAYLVDHRITGGFPSGTLTLLSMNGPVVWNANANCLAGPAEPLFTVVHESLAINGEQLHQQRVAANLAAIQALVKNMREGVRPPQQAPDYLLEVSRTWEALGGLL